MPGSQRPDCFREFARYASLSVLGMPGLSCYILADTYFISYGLGTDGLTALNPVIPVYSLIHGIGLMTGIGAGTKYSLHKNTADAEEADRLFTNAVLLAAIISAVFVFTGMFFSGHISALLEASGHSPSLQRLFTMTAAVMVFML